MSNAIYPDNLPGRAWPRKRAPVWKTTIKATPSGREWRSASMLTPRYRYTLQYNFLRSKAALQEFQTLFGFFNARSGSFDSFLFRDPDDNTVANQPVGTGDGIVLSFQLLRALGGFSEPVGALSGAPLVRHAGGGAGVGSFERDANTDGLADGWTRYSAGTTGTLSHSLSGSAVQHGSFSQLCGASALGATSSDRQGLLCTSTGAALVAGQAMVGSCNVEGSANTTLQMSVQWYNAGGTLLGATAGSGASLAATGAAQQLVTTGVCPADAATYRIYIYQHSNTAGGAREFRVDAVQLEPGSVPSSLIGARLSLLPDVDYTVDANAVAAMARAPAGGVQITWSGSYYWRCRFDADDLPFEQFMSQFWKTGEVKLITVKP